MATIFLTIYDGIEQLFTYALNILNRCGGYPFYFSAVVGVLTIRFLIKPALKGKAGSSDSVRKTEE